MCCHTSKLVFCSRFANKKLINTLATPDSKNAQGRLRVGLSGNFGKEYFKIKSHDYIVNNSKSQSQSSNIAIGSGIWLEKPLAKRISIIPEVGYHFVSVNDKVIVDQVAAIPGEVKETFHSLFLGVNARYYLFIRNDFRVFADAGLKVDKTLYFKFQHSRTGAATRSMPDDFRFANPGALGGIGISKARWGVGCSIRELLWSCTISDCKR
jgi:hypothetical protein